MDYTSSINVHVRHLRPRHAQGGEATERPGESLFYPWRVPSPKKKARHIDGVLSTSIRRLKSGEDEEEVLSSLRLHLEGRLPGEADRHYRRAVEGLREAAGRDW
ncbi:MAG: hypothetical protein GQ558_03970, partial [Thermoplasmata archaeon]|nr:hypothetical protein [Thermoplasmata archaeon]